MVHDGDTLIINPSRMEVKREYLMKLGTMLLVAVKTPNDNIMLWHPGGQDGMVSE